MAERIHASTAGVDTDIEPLRPDASLGELLSELTEEFGQLVRKEIELARVETSEELAKAKQAATMGGVAAVSALLALVMLSHALAWLLDEWMHEAIAYGIVGAVWLIAAAALGSTAKRRIGEMRGLPQTKTTIKEDMEWARAQRS
jgi:uncharacterized membrane protein YqjE